MIKKRRRNTAGYWYGVIGAAVQADREQRGELPDLFDDDVLAWADAFFARNGDWPTSKSGPIPEAPGETWFAVEAALALGIRGFSPGGTLPRFFAQHRGRYNQSDQQFSIRQILAWTEAWRARTGQWPTRESGDIPGAGGMSWYTVDHALRVGCGGLPGGSSLFHLLTGNRVVVPRSPLTTEQILAWADAFHARTGEWPGERSGPIPESPDETWTTVKNALRRGSRGLPGRSSLVELLMTERGVRCRGYSPPLTVPTIIEWAEAHHARTGKWPHSHSGPILECPGAIWRTVTDALSRGTRGLPGGSTIPRLLAQRGTNRLDPPDLTIPQIRAWAEAFRARTGQWPNARAGSILEAPGETWRIIELALRTGQRGLAGHSSLSRLYVEERPRESRPRQARARPAPLPLTTEQILAWADAHHVRTGDWPLERSGRIPEAPKDSWRTVSAALSRGSRGLPGGATLIELLVEERGVRKAAYAPRLTVSAILGWADAFHARAGRWPTATSGPLPEAPGENWSMINSALGMGNRGLPGGSSLVRLLARERGARNLHGLPPFSFHEILRWADLHHSRHGTWPDNTSGPIPEAPGETWMRVRSALMHGSRGLPRGATLKGLLWKHRGVRYARALAPFTVEDIFAWSDAHHARTGTWPGPRSGPIPQCPGATWRTVDDALCSGNRGLKGGSSLFRLLAERRAIPLRRRLPDSSIPQFLTRAE
jgi:hypothetical protein